MPVETFQTLKSKATKQAKKSGMSQSAAEKYGSVRASQAAQVGGAVALKPSGGGIFEEEFILKPFDVLDDAGNIVEYPPKKEGIFDTGIEGLSKSDFDTIVKVAEAEAAGKSTEGLVDHLKKTRSVENIRNKQAAYDEILRGEHKDFPSGNVIVDKDGRPILDSSGNPILTSKGKKVFDETRGEFRTGSEALRQASPELYKEMYPMSSFGMTGLPSIMPGVGTLKRLLEGATGTGRDILGGTGKAVAPAFGGIGELFGLNKIPGAIGNIFNKWNFGPFRGGRVSTAIPAGDGGGGGGAGIPSLYAGPITTPDQTPADIIIDTSYDQDDGFKPGIDPDNPYGLPDAYIGWYDSPFNIPNPGASAAVVTPVTLPDGTVVNMPDPYTANQFQQYMASQTQTPATTPTPHDYSQWPQFGSQYPAGGPVPNYINQGLGQGPHFDYWNQIAKTFPGMR